MVVEFADISAIRQNPIHSRLLRYQIVQVQVATCTAEALLRSWPVEWPLQYLIQMERVKEAGLPLAERMLETSSVG